MLYVRKIGNMQKKRDTLRQGDWGVKRSVFICTVNVSKHGLYADK